MLNIADSKQAAGLKFIDPAHRLANRLDIHELAARNK